MKVAETLFEIGKVMEEWGDTDEVRYLHVWSRHVDKEASWGTAEFSSSASSPMLFLVDVCIVCIVPDTDELDTEE